MKTIIPLLAACLMLAACNKKESPAPDVYVCITLNGAAATPIASETTKAPPLPAPYTIQTVARWAYDITLYSPAFGQYTSRATYGRDTVAGKLIIGDPEEIMYKAGDGYKLGWLVEEGISDMVCRARYNYAMTDWRDPLEMDEARTKYGFAETTDTLGYIPNAVLRRAEAAIKTAFDAGDYEACMRLFDEAYVFVPITGPEWRALKEAGIE